MTRIAVYECPCCGRRLSSQVEPGQHLPKRLRCDGWCLRCGGGCLDDARRLALEPAEEPEAIPVAEASKPVRFIRASRRLDLPTFQPQDLAW